MIYTRDHLLYQYTWTTYSTKDPRVSGYLDDTPFDRKEGHQVLYMINRVMDEMGYDKTVQGNIIEEMLCNDVPKNLSAQWEVKSWMVSRLKQVELSIGVFSSATHLPI